MLRWSRSLFLVLLLAATSVAAQSPALDRTGERRFWRVVDDLAAGREPAAAAWDALFATPGYAALEAREHRRAAITLGIRAAINPSLATVRDSILIAGGWTARVVRHIREVVPRRSELDAFLSHVEQAGVLRRGAELAAPFLPPGSVERFGLPRVAFLYFLPDGRGYPGLIVADVANLAGRSDTQLVRFFGHEAVHYYRWAFVGAADTARPTDRLDDLLTKLQEEGIADLLDKLPELGADSATMVRNVGESRAEYLWAYRAAAERVGVLVAELDSTLAAITMDAAHADSLVDAFGDRLPLEGRPLGSFLAAKVRDAMGPGVLGETLLDPAAFLMAYDAASRAPSCTGCPRLSEGARRLLEARVRH